MITWPYPMKLGVFGEVLWMSKSTLEGWAIMLLFVSWPKHGDFLIIEHVTLKCLVASLVNWVNWSLVTGKVHNFLSVCSHSFKCVFRFRLWLLLFCSCRVKSMSEKSMASMFRSSNSNVLNCCEYWTLVLALSNMVANERGSGTRTTH